MKQTSPKTECTVDDYNSAPNKMSRFPTGDNPSNLDLRFLIPSRAAGIIIGKGGESIKDIREKYEIKVNIPDSVGPERVLQISGPMSPVMEALEFILEKVKDAMSTSESDMYSEKNRNRSQASDSSASDGVDLRMLIHQSQAGAVIGRGGEYIKELRQKAELKSLKVYQILCPLSTDRVLQMVGPVSKIVGCIQVLLEKLQSCQIRGQEQMYDARNFEESQALSYGGWLSKGALKNVQEYGTLRNAGGGAGAAGNVGGPGSSSNAYAAIAAARSALSQAVIAANGGPMMIMPGAHMNLPFDRAQMAGGPTKTVQVSVPNSFVGAIMGRGGGRIRSIREESGANIRIQDADKTSGGDRIIDITGTQMQIAYAQQVLKSCVLIYHDKK